ncbi:MAG: HD domain-containing phosphohydrolase [Candidatus Zixiibacteriota bacterium]
MNKRARILVVDDEDYICSIVHNTLADEKSRVVKSCTDSRKALELIKNERVDLILTDMVMDNVSGVDILKASMKYQPDCVVIFMTGHPTVQNAISVLKLGAYDYLVKPFKLENLKASVERALEKLCLSRENVRLKNTVSLYQISEAMGSSIHVDALLKLVLNSIVAEFNACMATISLIDPHAPGVQLRAFHGIWDDIAKVPLLIGEDRVNTNVINSGKAEMVRDVRVPVTGPDGRRRIDEAAGVSVPLYAKGNVIGTLNIVRTGMNRSFTIGDMHSLSIMASKAASALESSMLYDELEDAYLSTIRALANSVEARDHYTRGHTDRVTHVAEAVAHELSWSEDEVKWLKIGGTLHDIGKIGIPDRILNKPGPLNQDEAEIMRQHPQMGAKMLDGIPFLEPILPYILYHHERWDGRGYPHGLKGTDIPIQGRLLAIADTVDAILSDRPYRKANVPEKVIDELLEFRGVQFDPDLVDAFMELWKSGKLDLRSLYGQVDADSFVTGNLDDAKSREGITVQSG